MKNSLHTNPLLFKMAILVTCFMLVILYNKSKAATIAHIPETAIDKEAIVVFKQSNHNQLLTASLKQGINRTYTLFIFSADGHLMNQLSINSLRATTIMGLKKGLYLYECFDDDLRINSGIVTVK